MVHYIITSENFDRSIADRIHPSLRFIPKPKTEEQSVSKKKTTMTKRIKDDKVSETYKKQPRVFSTRRPEGRSVVIPTFTHHRK